MTDEIVLKDHTATAKIFIATPSQDGTVHAAHAFSMMRTLLTTSLKISVPDAMYDGDVVRVRSRYVADFLASDATHLLFIDSDIEWDPALIEAMVEIDRDYVAAPYRKKRETTSYPIIFTDEHDPDEETNRRHGLHLVAGVGLGFTLLKREMLERMVEHYRHKSLSQRDLEHWEDDHNLTFDDEPQPGVKRETVALFDLVITERRLLSEDLSFGHRWRAIGGQIWLFLGGVEGLAHHGTCRFAGKLTDFGAVEILP